MLGFTTYDLNKTGIQTIAIPVCENEEICDNPETGVLVKKAKKLKEFQGKEKDEIIFYDPPEINAKRVILSGLGKLEKINPEVLRAAAGRAVKKCIRMNLQDLLIAVPDAKKISIKKREMLEAVLEGAFLGNYIFNKYKKDKALQPLKKVDLVVSSRDAGRYRQLPSRIEAVCSGTILAREWINTPSNDKRPDQFTKSIVNNARKARLKVRVLAEKELRQEKCCGILAVGSGSNSSPAMIILEYNPKGASKTLGLVGKGVTFDSGGINLKSTGSIEDMKMDMSGAAAVAALLITAAKLKPELKIVGVIPVVENMPSGNAFRPGDIVKSYTGKTIEIGNTDAEGRLILIDALAYCIKKYKPDTLIDLATLTGACVVALGEKIAGVFSSEEKLLRDICASGKKTSERCWNLPMPDDYKELLKSDFADIKNISSSRWGGAITAALFLSEFIENTKWAHIDIAGPAYIKKANDYCGPGGTGFGVRLLCDLLDRL